MAEQASAPKSQEELSLLRELSSALWQEVSQLASGSELRRVKIFLDAFGANRPVRPTDPRQVSAPGRYLPGLAAVPWYDPDRVRGAHALCSAFAAIKEDFLSITREGRQFVSYEDADDYTAGRTETFRAGRRDDIDVFVTHLFNQDVCRNTKLCPGVERAVEGTWFAGALMFSILKENNFIGAHSDLTNYILTLHLGIRVPEGAGIRVAGETNWWTEGECIVFDASYIHEVWNRGPGDRAVLIAEAWHPDLTAAEIAALSLIRPRIREWEKARGPAQVARYTTCG
jgi:hypothetical protein